MTSKSVRSSQAAGSVTAQETPALLQKTKLSAPKSTASDTAWEREQAAAAREETEQDRMIDKIGRMAEEGNKQEETNVDDISPEERERQDEIPRNPKKRMYEANVEEPARDEL